MGTVEDRWWRTVLGERRPRERCGRGLRWRARYRHAEGRQRSRSFARKPEAVRFLTLVQADLLRGSHIDPGRLRTPLSAYAGKWLGSLSVRPSTRRTCDSHLRTWILPALGGRADARVDHPDGRADAVAAADRQSGRHPQAHYVHGLLSSILRAAVEDGLQAGSSPSTAVP
jgi:hypothetical protein